MQVITSDDAIVHLIGAQYTRQYATQLYSQMMSTPSRNRTGSSQAQIESIADIITAEEEQRPHDVLVLLTKFLDQHRNVLRSFNGMCRFLSVSVYYDATETNKMLNIADGKSLSLLYSNGEAKASLDLFMRSVDFTAFDNLSRQLPKHVFISAGTLKFVCWDFFLDGPEKAQGSLREMWIEATPKCKAISLSYLEVYVEPWLHLPHLLLNRPNPKMTSRVLEYWGDIAGFDIRLETLERVIIASILVDRWDDDIWMGAHSLLTLP